MSKPGEDSVYANKFAIMQKQIDEKDKRIKELEEENRQLEAIKNDAIRRYNFESISKQKVKDKIDKLNKKYEDSKDENGESPYYYPSLTIKTLQGLLEDK